MVKWIGVTKTYDESGGGESADFSADFGNFGGDCPVLKSGRKGHTSNTEYIKTTAAVC